MKIMKIFKFIRLNICATIPFDLYKFCSSRQTLDFNPMMLLHVEQYIELKKPLPTSAKVINEAKISNIYDKKGALVIFQM